MEITMKRFIAVLLTLFLLITVLYKTNSFFIDKSGDAKYTHFMEAPERYDVVFFGSSHTVMGILPMEIWHEQRISTYNLGNYGQLLPADYWILKEVLSMNKPELVVVDAFTIMSDNKYGEQHLSYLHEVFDNFKYSKLKKEAISDLFPEEMWNDFLCPFSIYHSQWENIQQELFIDSCENYTYGEGSDENGFYGAKTDILVKPQETVSISSQNVNNTDTAGTIYLRKIIELCQENDIDILLTLTPFILTEEQAEWNNRISLIANEYGIPFFDGTANCAINPVTDMWDSGHLNSSGAQKWSSALGQYIVENYNIPQYNEGEIYDYWNSLYNNTYIPYKIDRIKEQDNLYNYLMLAADKNFSVCIHIPEQSNVYNDYECIELIKNLSPYKTLNSFDNTANNGKRSCFVIIDSTSCSVWEYMDGESISALQTSFGYVNFHDNQLLISNYADNQWETSFQDTSNISIVLINNLTGAVIDDTLF